jgi:saxitoxin biosynthesis operon SxtJ-like protein
MSLIRIDPNPSRRQLAVFGITWLVFFTVAGVLARRNGGSETAIAALWSAAVVVPTIGWIRPSFMRIIYLGMAYLTLPVGLVVSYLLLAVIYYLVLTPIGFLMRIVAYDPMDRHFDRTARSYWVSRKGPETIDSYFQQF